MTDERSSSDDVARLPLATERTVAGLVEGVDAGACYSHEQSSLRSITVPYDHLVPARLFVNQPRPWPTRCPRGTKAHASRRRQGACHALRRVRNPAASSLRSSCSARSAPLAGAISSPPRALVAEFSAARPASERPCEGVAAVVGRRSAVPTLAPVVGARPSTRASRTVCCVAPRGATRRGRESLDREISPIAAGGVSSGPSATSAARNRSASSAT